VNLAASGAFDGIGDRWNLVRHLADLLRSHPSLRVLVYELLKLKPITSGLALLAQAVAENPDTEGCILLVELEKEHKRSFLSQDTIEKVVTEHVPSEDWQGAYNIVPVPVVALRRDLLAMIADGGPADVAARCLNQIDELRDRHGTPDSEPRHPDFASAKSWPILSPVSN
jgi:hypothetical protein